MDILNREHDDLMVKQWISRLSPKCSGTKATLKTLWTPSPHLQSHQVEAVADEGPHWLDSNDCGCGVLPPFWKIPCHSVFSQPAKIELTSGSCHFFQQQQMGWLHRLISKWDPTDICHAFPRHFCSKLVSPAQDRLCVCEFYFLAETLRVCAEDVLKNSSGALL